MRTIIKSIVLAVYGSILICSCGSDDDSKNSSNELERNIVGIWTGTVSTDLSKTYHRYDFNQNHIVWYNRKSEKRTYTETDGIRTYSSWEFSSEESRQGRWEITDGDTPTPNIFIRWDDGGEMFISLYLFDGTTISGGLGYYLHKGNYFD